MAKSTKSAAALKPYDGFPLTAHRGAQQWCKKLKFAGKKRTFYFGPLSDWPAALKRYEREWPYRVQGLEPPVLADDKDACTLRVLCNLFLEAKRNRVASGELTDLSYRDYFRACKRLVDHFGPDRRVDDLGPADFEAYRSKLATKFATSSLSNEVGRCRVLFKFAADQRLIAAPVHFGQSFDKPGAKAIRRHRNNSDKLLFSREELLAILSALAGVDYTRPDGETVALKADPQLRAMTLLGINAGLGVTDCGCLRTSHIDLSRGWLNYPRVKTETDRQAALWPETVEALQAVLQSRREPRSDEDADIVFLTRTRQRWVRTKLGATAEKNLHLNAISVRIRESPAGTRHQRSTPAELLHPAEDVRDHRRRLSRSGCGRPRNGALRSVDGFGLPAGDRRRTANARPCRSRPVVVVRGRGCTHDDPDPRVSERSPTGAAGSR